MREVYKEEDFYKDKGWPSERLVYSKYILNIVGDDYDQFILVVKAEYPAQSEIPVHDILHKLLNLRPENLPCILDVPSRRA